MTKPAKTKSTPVAVSNDVFGQSGSFPRPEQPVEGPKARPVMNDAESPLSWLRTRRDRSGRPLIDDSQYLAGERLRMDFERAMLARRTTMNWDAAASGGSGGNISAELSDGAIAARQRYHKAMEAVGPELSSILMHVCCMASGIEQVERVLNLPSRSGKAVLGLALTSLARHYGLNGTAERKQSAPARWGMEDYRPSIPALEEA